MTKTESSKFDFKIIVIVVLILSLLAVSVSAYVFKDKIFGQNNIATLEPIDQTQKPNSPAEVAKTDPKPQSSLALPFFVIQGIGKDPKVMSVYEADKNPEKLYPDNVEVVKIYDQNNKELSSPQLKIDDRVVRDGDNYYIVQILDTKK